MTKAKKKSSRKAPANRKSSKKKKGRFFARAFRWAFILGLWGGIFFAGIVLWYAKDLPDITQSATFERRHSIIVKAADGRVIGRYGESKGENVRVDELPPHLIHAVLSIEDRRFYDHPGVDILGIGRAMVVNLQAGRFAQGGSTITQQLAKNLFLSHDRKLARKIQEALLALWLERELSKDEILSAYLNRVYLGSGTYGVEAASRLYFDKSARDVTLREAAILAGLLKAPSRYSPHNSMTLAKERSDVVIEAMKQAGYLDGSDISRSDEMAVSLPHRKTQPGGNMRYFTDWVIDGLDDVVGRPGMDLVIETTLHAGLQEFAQDALVQTIDAAGADNRFSQGAIVSMSPNGAVLSMVGGYDYGQSQFNRTTQAKRPPGSAFKPVVYLAALEKGWDAHDEILDAPLTEGTYRPKNFAGKYYGTVDLETALAQSMNTATIRLTKDIGISSVMDMADRLGIISPLERDLSLALGSSGISMLEMGTVYARLANGGFRVFPYAITRVTNSEGRVLYSRKKPSSYQSVVRQDDVREITSMMERVIYEGTGRAAQLPFSASGKTGTSQDSRDAWFVGYTNRMVSIVWLGNDDNSPMKGVTGGGLPARIWRDVMRNGHEREISAVYFGTARGGNNNRDSNGGGITGLLGRLLSPQGNSGTQVKDSPQIKDSPRLIPTKRQDDYSNLNE